MSLASIVVGVLAVAGLLGAALGWSGVRREGRGEDAGADLFGFVVTIFCWPHAILIALVA